MHRSIRDARMGLLVDFVSNRKPSVVMRDISVTRIVRKKVVGKTVSLVDKFRPKVRRKMHSFQLLIK
jgi:cytidylate kinase